MKWIFSVDRNWHIGLNNDLLVRIPEDLEHFKQITMGQILLMGRKTFVSLKEGEPLPGRTHVVLTRNKDFYVPGVYIVRSKKQALECIETLVREKKREVFLIGGESVARQFIDETDEAYITHVEASFEADTKLPNLCKEGFVLVERSPLYHGDYDYYFAHYKRKDKVMDRTWDLTKMFADDEAFLEEFNRVTEEAKKISNYEGRLLESPSTLLEALRVREGISRRFEKLWTYGHLHHDSDTRLSRYQNYQAQLRGAYAQLGALAAYFEPELLAAPWEQILDFMEENQELGHYEQLLRDIFRHKAHVLSQKEEELLASLGEVMAAPSTIFSYLDNADFTFPVIKNEKGEEVELTQGNYVLFMESEDRQVRKEAYEALYSVYKAHKNTLASTLYSHIKAQVIEAKLRNFPSARAAQLHGNSIPEEVYDTLIDSVEDALPAMGKYLDLRKKHLGVDALHFYDIYAPLVKEVEYRLSYDEAGDIIQLALAPLGEDYVGVVGQGLRDRWIDVDERPGKRSGAYSSGCYDSVPYMLLNYQDNVSNLFTLIHEMGHSLHSYYSAKNQPYIYANYGIFLAEIASTFNEALLNHYLLETEEDPKKRLYLINHYLETFKGTLFRQTMFAEFEKEIYSRVEAGEGLSSEDFSRIYGELNDKYFCGKVEIDENIRHEWSRIPHFYYNFYVYQYATGLSAATSFAKGVLDKEEGALEGYLGFLKSGSSDYPVEVLLKAGLDMRSPQPVKEALEIFASLVDEFEKLLELE
ncbi:MAG: oligoendopeptidase F [Tissierellia bacterium]|nr:oligoendopeptidase F [Tissierellia bacterium]